MNPFKIFEDYGSQLEEMISRIEQGKRTIGQKPKGDFKVREEIPLTKDEQALSKKYATEASAMEKKVAKLKDLSMQAEEILAEMLVDSIKLARTNDRIKTAVLERLAERMAKDKCYIDLDNNAVVIVDLSNTK